MATAYTDGGVVGIVDTGAYAFIGPTVSVTIAAGNTIHVDGTATIGSTAGAGAQMARISACHQPNGMGGLTDNDADWSTIRVSQNNRVPMAVSQRIAGLAAGTYTVGLCYWTTAGQAVGWNYNDWVTVKVIVTQS